jgi:hypothetical protein
MQLREQVDRHYQHDAKNQEGESGGCYKLLPSTQHDVMTKNLVYSSLTVVTNFPNLGA